MTPRQKTMQDVEAVARIYRVKADEVMSHSRRDRAVKARQAVMWMLRYFRGWSYMEIGRLMNRDHSTVVYGIGRHDMRLGRQTGVSAQVSRKMEYARLWYYVEKSATEWKVAA